MAQVFGIIGFILSLLALFITSEVMRRTNHRHNELQGALVRTQKQLIGIETKVRNLEVQLNDMERQRKRQAETIASLAAKAEAARQNAAKPHAPAQPVQESLGYSAHRPMFARMLSRSVLVCTLPSGGGRRMACAPHQC